MATRKSTTYSETLAALASNDDTALVEIIKTQETIKTDANLTQAYAVRILVDERGWKAADVAKSTDLAASSIGRYLAKGRLLHQLPIEAHRLAWVQSSTRGVNDETLENWTTALQGQETEARAAYLTSLSARRVVAERLGDSAKPETIDALASKVIEQRAFTPAAMSAALPGVALAAGINLPTTKREPQVNDDAPTFQRACRLADAFRQGLAKAIADRVTGTPEGQTPTITAQESQHLREVREHLAQAIAALDKFEDASRLADTVSA